MTKLYWKLRQSLSMRNIKQGAVVVHNKRLKRGAFKFYPCNRWGVGWHMRRK